MGWFCVDARVNLELVSNPDEKHLLPGWARVAARARGDLAAALLFMLVLVVPLFRSSSLEDSFNTPKITLAAVLVVCAAAAWLVSRFETRGGIGAKGLRPCPVGAVSLAVLGLWAVHMVSFAWADSRGLALQAAAYWCVFVLLHFTFAAVLSGAEDVWIVLRLGIAAAVATAAWTIFEDATRKLGLTHVVARLPDWRGYLSAGLGNSGHIAGFIGIFLPAAIIDFLQRRRFSVPMFLAIAVMFAALIVTWSVGSTGATVLSLLVWGIVATVVMRGGATRLQWKRLGWLIAGGLALTTFYLLPHPLNPHAAGLWHEAFGSQRWEEGWPTRVAIWMTTNEMISNHPVWGVGLGNFTYAYVQQVVPGLLADPNLRMWAGLYTNDAHNEFLQVQAETGILGSVALLAVIITFFSSVVAGLRRKESGAAERLALVAAGAGVTTILLDSLMSFPLRLPAHLAALMFCLAVPSIVAKRAREAQRSEGHSSFQLSLRVCVMALLVPGLLALGWQGRRTLAENVFKRGRNLAEELAVSTPEGLTSAWRAAETASNGALMNLAMGNEVGMTQALTAARVFATTEGMDEVAAAYDRAVAIDGRYTNASSRRGALLLMEGRLPEGIEQLRLTLRDLQAPEIHERLAMALMLSNRKAEAAPHWKILSQRQPNKRAMYEALFQKCKP
ncbi:hypothetical protein CVU37_14935 [candidate division BRC1 bacterium HGW-BRC1-1]|nr:MAG: hypothetical protein CVU37_14935 [candidate division BRC1 bacterium HGW-BRC1-1]